VVARSQRLIAMGMVDIDCRFPYQQGDLSMPAMGARIRRMQHCAMADKDEKQHGRGRGDHRPPPGPPRRATYPHHDPWAVTRPTPKARQGAVHRV